MNLFGKKKQQAPNTAETIVRLRENLTMLEKREDFISKKIAATLDDAKGRLARKDKKGAMFCLKRKKMFEAEVSKLQGARVTMESQILSLESAAVNVEIFRALETGASAMRAVRGNIDADKVDDIVDDLEEEKAIHDQISDAISRPAEGLFDDADLLAELEELEQDAVERDLVSMPHAPVATAASRPAISMPDVPNRAPVVAVASHAVAEDEDAAALRELQASML